ncbi:MAG: hypothetical protein SFW67_29795 [Myxococcaceae bacterium]|nr:hypothetical protein [Myxococcaceae bacterium]
MDFSSLVQRHVLVARARARMLEDVRADKAWGADLVAGTVSIGEDAYEAQLLGTFSLSSHTFLWGWANPGAPQWSRALTLATSLKGSGGLFAEAKLHANEVNPNELAAVAGELAGGFPVFVGTYDGGAAFLVLTGLPMPLERFSLAYLPGVVLDLPVLTTQPPRACVEPLLQALGFTVTENEAGQLSATRGPSVFRLGFDAEGRPGKLELTHRA